MDNFMDKIAHKLSAQEAIRANAAADAAQMEKLESQIAEYDACMKEMRKLNLKNAENEQKLKELLEESRQEIRKLAEESILKIQEIQEAQADAGNGTEEKELLEELKASAADNLSKVEELFRNSDDFVHKENVKVYRNVQAAMVEELQKQTQAIMEHAQAGEGKNKKLFLMNCFTLAAVLIQLVLFALHLAGLL